MCRACSSGRLGAPMPSVFTAALLSQTRGILRLTALASWKAELFVEHGSPSIFAFFISVGGVQNCAQMRE